MHNPGYEEFREEFDRLDSYQKGDLEKHRMVLPPLKHIDLNIGSSRKIAKKIDKVYSELVDEEEETARLLEEKLPYSIEEEDLTVEAVQTRIRLQKTWPGT
ncbi:MAG: hypothetical protein ABEJ95_04590 [Candidatus Nanohalobium sp.]